MNKYISINFLIIVVLIFGENSVASEISVESKCEMLKWNREKYNKPYFPILKPGKYCLDRDYEFSCSIFAHGCGGNFIDILSDNVDVDMRGHVLSVSGTSAFSGVYGRGENIRIHDGKFKDVGVGIHLLQKGNGAVDPLYAHPDQDVEPRAVFLESKFVIENMEMINVHRALLISGSGNQIRNNKFGIVFEDVQQTKYTDDAKVAISIYGPNNVFEFNQINARVRGISAPVYAVYLRNSNGTELRNNVFCLPKSYSKSVFVGVSNTKDVKIYKNTFENPGRTIFSADSSTFEQYDNQAATNSGWDQQ